MNPTTVDAGDEVTISVTTKPRAFVGISAIDQRSLAMGHHKPLTQVRIDLISRYFGKIFSQSYFIQQYSSISNLMPKLSKFLISFNLNSLTFSWNKSHTQKKGLNEFLGRICPKFCPKMFIQLFF